LIRSVIIAVLALSACGPSSELEERNRVLSSIELLRTSSPDDHANRRALAAELAKVQANDPLAIEARDACAKAYTLLAEANEEQAALAAELPASKQDAEKLQAGLLRAQAAIAKIDESSEKMTVCDRASSELRTKK
jgi:hypothetical protein